MHKKLIKYFNKKYKEKDLDNKSKFKLTFYGLFWEYVIAPLIIIILSFKLKNYFPSFDIPLQLRIIFSIFLFFPALYLTFLYIIHLNKMGKGTIIPAVRPPKKLVKDGVYKICRNPMWLGYILLFLGFGVLLSSFFILVIAIPIILFFIFLYVRLIEERVLEKQFGKDYATYKKETPFLLPFKLKNFLKNK